MSLMVDCDGNLMTSCEGTLMSGWTITVQGLNLNTTCWPRLDIPDAYQNWFKDLNGNWVTNLDGTYDITCAFTPTGVPGWPYPYLTQEVKIGELWLSYFWPATNCNGTPFYAGGYPVKTFDIVFRTPLDGNLVLGAPAGYPTGGYNALFLAAIQTGLPMTNTYQSAPGWYRPTAAWGGTCIIR